MMSSPSRFLRLIPSFWSSDILTGNQTVVKSSALNVEFWSSDILTGNQTRVPRARRKAVFWGSDILTGNQTGRSEAPFFPLFWSSDILTGNQTERRRIVGQKVCLEASRQRRGSPSRGGARPRRARRPIGEPVVGPGRAAVQLVERVDVVVRGHPREDLGRRQPALRLHVAPPEHGLYPAGHRRAPVVPQHRAQGRVHPALGPVVGGGRRALRGQHGVEVGGQRPPGCPAPPGPTSPCAASRGCTRACPPRCSSPPGSRTVFGNRIIDTLA